MPRARSFRSAALVLPALLVALAGCSIGANERSNLGAPPADDREVPRDDIVTFEVFDLGSVAPAIGEDIRPGALATESVSNPLDRSSWEKTRLVVPTDGTIHRRELSTHLDYTDATPRQRGQSPTVHSALDLFADADAQTAEGLLAGPYALFDAVMIIPRALIERPWMTSSPRPENGEGYQRDPFASTPGHASISGTSPGGMSK